MPGLPGTAGAESGATGGAGAAGGAGHLLALVRSGRALTRRDLLEVTGLSRSTVAARVDALVAAGYLREAGIVASARGRPRAVLALDERRRAVLAADLGASHARVAVCDLGGRVVAERSGDLAIASGPDAVLSWLEERWRELLAATGTPAGRLAGFGVSLPGSVDAATGRLVHPPLMPGWHDHPVRERLEAAFEVPGVVENDAAAMAIADAAARPPCPSLLFVKVATGIGAGVVVDGRLVRGADGAAGDLGHVRITSADDGPLCACGARGCLAASASGGALARRLREQGVDAARSRDAVRLALAGDARALALVREAGLVVGDVLATAVSLLNPRLLVLGGDLAAVPDHFVGAVRERLYQRVQPLAARRLRVVASDLGERAAVLGAARLVIESVLDARAVDAELAELAGPAGLAGLGGVLTPR